MNFETKIDEYFKHFNERFFDKKLLQVKLELSSKMKSSAGIFYPKRKSEKFARIRLNHRLLENRTDKEIMETLLHEMTHAFLSNVGKGLKPHGKEFKQKAREINKALSIDIKTTHRYLTWWRCDGKCRDLEASLFGYVSRVSNDKKFDLLDIDRHRSHKINCGGKFQEVDEPPKDRLKVIIKRNKMIKSNPNKNKKIKKVSSKTRFTLNYRSDNTIDYVTSDDEA